MYRSVDLQRAAWSFYGYTLLSVFHFTYFASRSIGGRLQFKKLILNTLSVENPHTKNEEKRVSIEGDMRRSVDTGDSRRPS